MRVPIPGPDGLLMAKPAPPHSAFSARAERVLCCRRELYHLRRDRFLWIVLAVGAALRLWRINGDLPYVFHFDEPTLVNNAVWLIQHGSLNPHFFGYPTGLIYLLAALFGIVLLGGMALGRFDGAQAAVAWLASHTYPQPPTGGMLYLYPTIGLPALYLIGRTISALAGIAVIALVYTIGRRVAEGRGPARIAALAMAISPLAVEHSRLITTDMTATLLACACMLAVLAAESDGGGVRRWITAGALGGLAAGVKYNAGLVALVLAVLAIWELKNGRRTHTKTGRLPRLEPLRLLAWAAVAAIAAFLITTPFALFDTATFLRDFGYEIHRAGAIPTPFKGAEAVQATPAEKIAWVFRNHLGFFGLIATAWGGVVAARARRFPLAAILAWAVMLLLPLLWSRNLYPRYLLPVWPAVVLLASIGLLDGAARIKRRAGERLPALAVTALLCVAVVSPGVFRLAQLEAKWTGHDPRVAMTSWLEQNVPDGEQIVCEPVGAFPDPNRFSIRTIDFLGLSSPETYGACGVRYLAGSGRELLIKGKAPFREVLSNLDAIRASSDCVWSKGRYAIYRLRLAPGWQDTVREAMKGGDEARARAILEKKVKEADGSTPFAWKSLAEVREQLADTAGAVAAWRELARIDSTDVVAFLALGNLATATRDWDEAQRYLDHALRLSPRDPLIHHNMAVVLLSRAQERMRRGDRDGGRADWDGARRHAELCARSAPGDSSAASFLRNVIGPCRALRTIPRANSSIRRRSADGCLRQ